jgi:hypothetical protein
MVGLFELGEEGDARDDGDRGGDVGIILVGFDMMNDDELNSIQCVVCCTCCIIVCIS